MTFLAVAITGSDIGKASQAINRAFAAGAEMLELRADSIREINAGRLKALHGCAKATNLPTIVTCRDRAEGGLQDLSQQTRAEVLVAAIHHGADYIDCEYDNFLKPEVRVPILEALSRQSHTRLILSKHDFDGPFDDLQRLYDVILAMFPQAVPKLVYTARHINDCFAALDLLREKDADAILLAMGEAGVLTRILARKFGSLVTYASVDVDSATAAGQPTVADFKGLYRWDRIAADTDLYGVIGSPVAHSMSPAIFNACFDAAEVNALYVPVLLEGGYAEFAEFMQSVANRQIEADYGFRGFSVTIPHKGSAMEYLDSKGDTVEGAAAAIGAVNTIKIGYNGMLSGCNTDCAGAIDALTAAMGIEPHGLHDADVAVLGAGGVARAVVAGLAEVGARITIYNRTLSKAQDLAEEFHAHAAPLDALPEMSAKVIVNCTSIGMHPNTEASPLASAILRPDMTVFDTVYNPFYTRLLRDAKAAGATVVPGLEMFVRQALAQYRVWLNAEPDEQIIRKTLHKTLAQPDSNAIE